MISGYVTLLSGGMDSTVLLAKLRMEDEEVPLYAVSVDYGQRHSRELLAAADIAKHYNAEHIVLDMSGLRDVLDASALTSDDIAVPDGHYAEESMRATVVPNRNLILLSVAAGVAVTRKAHVVATAVHAGDHFIYPDCRPDFIRAARSAIFLGTLGFGPDGAGAGGIDLMAPFVNRTKTWIAEYGTILKVPFELTWSCYKGGAKHCGTCGTCVERKEAFANLEDPTEYDQ